MVKEWSYIWWSYIWWYKISFCGCYFVISLSSVLLIIHDISIFIYTIIDNIFHVLVGYNTKRKWQRFSNRGTARACLLGGQEGTLSTICFCLKCIFHICNPTIKNHFRKLKLKKRFFWKIQTKIWKLVFRYLKSDGTFLRNETYL